LQPVGPKDRSTAPRNPNVGDGHVPSADVRVLKRSVTTAAPAARSRPAVGTKAAGSAPRATTAAAPSLASPAAPAAAGSGAVPGGLAARTAELCASLRVPADPASAAAIAALMGEGLRLDPARIMAVRRAALRHASDPAAARLAARAVSAGLDPESVELDSALCVLDAPAGRRDGSDGSGSADRRAGDETPLSAAAEEEAASVAFLSEALMKAARRSLEEPTLAAMSKPDADGSGWACAPFELEYGGTEFHGFLRIWYYSNGMSRIVGRMSADIRCCGSRRLLELRGPRTSPDIAYYADDPRERAAFELEFGRRGTARSEGLHRGYLAELGSGNGLEADA